MAMLIGHKDVLNMTKIIHPTQSGTYDMTYFEVKLFFVLE